jgi:maltooligosyltrehalose trehalohydrolase
MQAGLPHPEDPRTFERSKLDLSERQRHTEIYALHRDLLRLRRQDPVLCAVQRPGSLDGAVLGPEAFVLRFFGVHGNDRLLIVNLGRDLPLVPAPEPLLAPPEEREWQTLWSSEDPRYGGGGTASLDTEQNWQIPGHAAVVLWPTPVEEAQPA